MMAVIARRPIFGYMISLLVVLVVVPGVMSLLSNIAEFGKKTLEEKDSPGFLGSIILSPIVIGYVLVLLLTLYALVWMTKRIFGWDQAAMLIGVMLAPALLLYSLAIIIGLFSANPQSALPGAPVLPICLALGFWFACGVVAYNDLKYRNPAKNNNGVKK